MVRTEPLWQGPCDRGNKRYKLAVPFKGHLSKHVIAHVVGLAITSPLVPVPMNRLSFE